MGTTIVVVMYRTAAKGSYRIRSVMRNRSTFFFVQIFKFNYLPFLSSDSPPFFFSDLPKDSTVHAKSGVIAFWHHMTKVTTVGTQYDST
jgi:hypothetical protein